MKVAERGGSTRPEVPSETSPLVTPSSTDSSSDDDGSYFTASSRERGASATVTRQQQQQQQRGSGGLEGSVRRFSTSLSHLISKHTGE